MECGMMYEEYAMVDSLKQVYGCLQDEDSKKIFEKRLLFSLTGHEGYIEEIVRGTLEGRNFLDKCYNKNLILYGGGLWCESILRTYPNLSWKCIWDNNRIGIKKVGGVTLEVVAPNYEDKESVIVVASRVYQKELEQSLINNGVAKDRIINAGKIIQEMSERQYFDLDAINYIEEEVFVDCGTFDGQTSVIFTDKVRGIYKKIYAFEPDEKNRKRSIKAFNEKGIKFQIFPYGCWDKKDILKFNSRGNGASSISDNGEMSVQVNSIDNMVDDKVTFIKMDVEGAESKALVGAKNTIRDNHPKLAISLYHKKEDIWEIPRVILSIDSTYRFYLRHYSITDQETVLYAI